ncbi:MAG: TerB family tellurite resistance protein [Gammaproteobacteria bacterium]|nr:TerB family tellurite resistance protein [Gammaproteobacteria bacterium]
MHIVLGLLTTLVTILFLLDRLGVDIGWLNPFHWRRRRSWARQYHGDPIYSVEDPLHIASLLVLGIARLDGDLTAEQKNKVLELFSTTFSMSDKEASELLASATYLLAAPQLVADQLRQLAKRSKDKLSREQAESMLKMMNDFGATSDRGLTGAQREYVDAIRTLFAQKPAASDSPWN